MAATQNQTLIFEIESLVLQSRTLTLEDKQKLLGVLSTLSAEQLQQMKAVFEEEKKDVEQIVKQELSAWNQFHTALATITEQTKNKLTYGSTTSPATATA